MNVLFVCRYNRFRSRVAAEFFKKMNRNKRINVRSAGAIKGDYPLYGKEVEGAKKFGININGRPRGLDEEVLDWYDVVVIVADDVPVDLFKRYKRKNQKVIVWRIPDDMHGDERKIKQIVGMIEKKVEGFVREVGGI